MPDGDSPFLAVPASEWLAANDSAFVIADRFPVSPGHALVVPRRVMATWWEATDAERADNLALIDEVKQRLDAEMPPDGYNVGFNSGAAAGHTIEHLHIHVILRYLGDVADPRGGVRHVIPGNGNHLLPQAEPYSLIDGQDRLTARRPAPVPARPALRPGGPLVSSRAPFSSSSWCPASRTGACGRHPRRPRRDESAG